MNRRLQLSLPAIICLVVSLLIQGCSGASTQTGSNPAPPAPPTPPAATVSIASPTNNAVLNTSPVTIQLQIANATTFKALLDGVDISSQFSSITNGTATATVTEPSINYGLNQLKISTGTVSANAQFTFNPAASPSVPGSSPINGQTYYIPVVTRVLAPNTDGSNYSNWSIVVGDATTGGAVPYPAQKPLNSSSNSTGFQVLVLKRTDLSLVSNATYGTDQTGSILALFTALDPTNNNSQGNNLNISQCGTPGCILVVQSLGTMGPNCNTSVSAQLSPEDCALLQQAFRNIGATRTLTLANGSSSSVGYSFIGNFGAKTVAPGAYYERLTCSGDNSNAPATNCDSIAPFNPQANPLSLPCCNAGISTSALTGTTPDQIGNISGAFVYDNYHNYTYIPTNRQLSFSIVGIPNTTLNNITVDTLQTGTLSYTSPQLPPGDPTNGTATNTSGPYKTTEGPGQIGGFHLLVMDASTLAPQFEGSFSVPFIRNLPANVYNLNQLSYFLNQFSSRRYLVFLGSMGDLRHDFVYGDGSGAMTQNVWDGVAQALYAVGGTWVAFQQTNQADNPDPSELGPMDYTLVGHHTLALSDLSQPYYAAEAAATISAQTTVHPVISNMQGVLSVDHEGYYAPSITAQYSGLVPSIVSTLTSAANLPNIGWPYYGSQGTQGDNNAFNWISSELCCTNIRAAYSNLNADPGIWLTELNQLNPSALYTTAPGSGGFSQAEYAEVSAQLATEFAYLAQVRDFQSNVVGLYQDQQSNVGLILQQAEQTILGQIDSNTLASQQVTQSNVFSIIQDGLNVAGPIANLASIPAGPEGVLTVTQLQASIGIITDLLGSATQQTNDGDGTPLLYREQTEVAAGQLAQNAADDFALSLISLGNSFDRVVSDWGRLKSVGAPLQANLITWDGAASGILLQAYNVAARRQMFTSLLKGSYTIYHYQNGDVDGNRSDTIADGGCGDDASLLAEFMANTQGYQWGFYPNSPVGGPSYVTYSSDGKTPQYNAPHDLWWDLYLITDNGGKCPTTSAEDDDSTHFFGLFDPLDPSNTTALGIYKPWFIHRSGLTIQDVNGNSDYFSSPHPYYPFAGDTDAF